MWFGCFYTKVMTSSEKESTVFCHGCHIICCLASDKQVAVKFLIDYSIHDHFEVSAKHRIGAVKSRIIQGSEYFAGRFQEIQRISLTTPSNDWGRNVYFQIQTK